MEVVKVENVYYKYPTSEDYVLKNLNLKVLEGEFVLVVGPSGSGKSTFVRLLNGLIPHYYGGELRGRVVVFGVDTRSCSVAELSKNVGIVFQDPENQLLTLTVEKEVAFGPENLGLPREEIVKRVEESLFIMGIEHLRYKLPLELSGGEQQKVVVSSILALKPRILVFDEPTSNMDPLSALKFIHAIKDLNDKGYTIIVVEHRLDMLAPIADRVIVFRSGRIVYDGEVLEAVERGVLEEVGVGDPQVSKLFKMLKSRFNLDLKTPITVEEGVELLRGLKIGRR